MRQAARLVASRRRFAAARYFVLGVLAIGCNALDKPGVDGDSKRVVPTDARPVQAALRNVPAISGGTLALSSDGNTAVAADPDRDRISIVSLSQQSVREVALEAGDEPGRVAIDNRGRAHIALRGSGSVVSVNLATAEVLQRNEVCAAPRGLAYDSAKDTLHVACADGLLVSLRAETGERLRTLDLEGDLRDVALGADGGLLVSRFKQAELVRVDANGVLASRQQPNESRVLVPDRGNRGTTHVQVMQPQLGWRMLPTGNGGAVMLHQSEAGSEIDVSKPAGDDSQDDSSPYGGGLGSLPCSGIVQTAVTRLDANGRANSVMLADSVLAVDMAIAPTGDSLVIAQAGDADANAPRPFTVFDESGDFFGGSSSDSAPTAGRFGPFGNLGPGRVMKLGMVQSAASGTETHAPDGLNANCTQTETLGVPGQPTAVAFNARGQLVVQSREPASLTIYPSGLSQPAAAPIVIDLGGESVFDTGHELFHRDSGGGIACASCHAEGAEDGHTWAFSDVGKRRTQAVHVGLKGTAPFHWNGDMHDLGMLMESVFVGRMGGVHQSDDRRAGLQRWLFSLHPPRPAIAADDPAAERGKTLFESSKLACSGCHRGAKLTDNQSYDVGTSKHGELMQVPSLHGVGYRAPFIHTGCAETLRQRFDPSCGGTRHGDTRGLEDAQIDDLIAYLRSL